MACMLRVRIHTRACAVLAVAAALASATGVPAPVVEAAPHASTPTVRVHLPADQAAHTGVHNEWWYLVGHLHGGGRTFGYELTIFKFHNVRPPYLSTPVSLFRTDLAVTDEQAHRFHEQITYHFPGQAGASTAGLDVHAGAVVLKAGAGNSMTASASLPGASFNLRLRSLRPALDVGGTGFIPFGDGGSYYYSLTDIASSGTLRIGAHTYRVSGVSWLDHQWGNWSWSGVKGWTWMALQLGNGIQMSVFDFHAVRSVSEANLLLPSGHTRVLPGVTITPTGRWRSPHTGATYPAGWRVRIPALHVDLRVLPTVADQELVLTQPRSGSYWEGSGRVQGTYQGKHVTGMSYTELTGFAR
jgi:predicted secreted hydrolase